MKVKQQNGLTLIEILIVVTLLMLILLAIFKVFNIDVNRARDAQRKSDLESIKLAFEDYYNDNQTYPPESFLVDCGGDSLKPYLKEVPCDPITGKPYLYLPFPGDGDNSLGYRILSYLDDHSDPIIEKLGCQNGCGLPENSSDFGNEMNYVYGIAQGVPLVLESIGSATPTSIPSNTISPSPTIDPNYCNSHICFCCANSAYVSSQDCNVWVPGNNCSMGPYVSSSECYENTPCKQQ